MTYLDDKTLETQTENVYNNKQTKNHNKVCGYDRLFHITYDYENKLHRDDRASRLGLNVANEEKNKKITILSSSVYGRGELFDPPSREHVVIESVYKGFYRSRGTG